MDFTFKVHPDATGDAARVAYHLPELPAGVSYKLHEAIKVYTGAVQNGPDGTDDEAFQTIKACPALTIHDVIAKLVYQLHFEHRGLAEDGALIIVESTDQDTAAIELAQTVLGELYAQIPQDWESARRAYHAAVVVEHEYDRRIYQPSLRNAQHESHQIAIGAEVERLLDLRVAAESTLLNIPAPTLAEWAIKVLICFDCDREMTGFTAELCEEARGLLGITEHPESDHSQDLAVLEATARLSTLALISPERKAA